LVVALVVEKVLVVGTVVVTIPVLVVSVDGVAVRLCVRKTLEPVALAVSRMRRTVKLPAHTHTIFAQTIY